MSRLMGRRRFVRSAALAAVAIGAGVVAALRLRPPRAQQAKTPERLLFYVIAEPCIGVKDGACVDVCPVDAIYGGEDQLYIHPDECIACSACQAECPVGAIFPAADLPQKWQVYIQKNRSHSSERRRPRPA